MSFPITFDPVGNERSWPYRTTRCPGTTQRNANNHTNLPLAQKRTKLVTCLARLVPNYVVIRPNGRRLSNCGASMDANNRYNSSPLSEVHLGRARCQYQKKVSHHCWPIGRRFWCHVLLAIVHVALTCKTHSIVFCPSIGICLLIASCLCTLFVRCRTVTLGSKSKYLANQIFTVFQLFSRWSAQCKHKLNCVMWTKANKYSPRPEDEARCWVKRRWKLATNPSQH